MTKEAVIVVKEGIAWADNPGEQQHHYNLYTVEEYEEIFKNAGFKYEEVLVLTQTDEETGEKMMPE